MRYLIHLLVLTSLIILSFIYETKASEKTALVVWDAKNLVLAAFDTPKALGSSSSKKFIYDSKNTKVYQKQVDSILKNWGYEKRRKNLVDQLKSLANFSNVIETPYSESKFDPLSGYAYSEDTLKYAPIVKKGFENIWGFSVMNIMTCFRLFDENKPEGSFYCMLSTNISLENIYEKDGAVMEKFVQKFSAEHPMYKIENYTENNGKKLKSLLEEQMEETFTKVLKKSKKELKKISRK